MPHAPSHHNRRSIRLPGYDDRAPGWYVMTRGAPDDEADGRALVAGICPTIWTDACVVLPDHLSRPVGR